ncbi:MAG: sulfotransferase family 2 domain-containing protein [Verrucomicrobiae bacterium]|nr:sulfotransferase family 2 domain-containing protein [Verrucomicrobiae bacterium]
MKIIRKVLNRIARNQAIDPFPKRFIDNTKFLTDPLGYHDLIFSILISLNYKYVYVATPKVANSTIKYSLIRLELDSSDFRFQKGENPHKRQYWPLLSPLSVPTFKEIVFSDEYFNFSFVRNPYSRLLASYLDKICRNQPEKRSILKTLNRNHRRLDQEVTFFDFVKAIGQQSVHERDRHWLNQDTHNYIGRIDYDFVGHLERFDEDIVEVFSHLKPGGEEYLQSAAGHATKASSKLSDYFTQEILEIANTIYGSDFDTFGYELVTKLPRSEDEWSEAILPKRRSGRLEQMDN